MPMGMGTPAALLNVLVTANTAQANAALAKTQAQLQATAATAQKTSAVTGASVARGLARGATAMGALGAGAIIAAAKFEDAFADVRKTVDATEPQFKRMEQGIRDLAKEIPVSVTEPPHLAGEAGALGVAAKDIVGFTKVAAQLGTATDLSASDAANALARLGNILGQKTVKDFQRMGATLVDLGNKGASTESEISEMSLRIARSGGVVGLSAKQVLGMAASLSNLGIKAESGGTAVSRAFLTMSEAIKAGGAELNTFAQVAGLSTEQFGKLFAKDAPTALGMFAEGLVKMNDAGKAVVPTLEKVGLNEIRVRDALLGLGQAQGEVAKGQQIANEAWGENSALAEEANKRYKTTSAQFQILKNRIFDVGIAFGQKLLPQVNKVMKELGKGNLGGAISAFAELGGKMAVALLKGLGKAFLESDALGRLFIAATLIRVIGGKGALLVAGRAIGAALGLGIGQGAATTVAGGKGGKGGTAAAAGGTWGKAFGAAAVVFMAIPIRDQMQKLNEQLLGGIGKSINEFQDKLAGSPLGAMFDPVGAIKTQFDKLKSLTAPTKEVKKFGESFDVLGKKIRHVGGVTDKEMKKVTNSVSGGSLKARRAFAANFDGVTEKAGDSMRKTKDKTEGGMASITTLLASKLKAFGFKGTIMEAVKEFIPGFQHGGLIPGAGSGDRVHVLAEPGEGFINKSAVKALGGSRAIDAINSRYPRFAKGGVLPTYGSNYPPGVMGARALNLTAGAGERLLKKSRGATSASWDSIDKLAAKLNLARGTLTGRIGQPNSRHGIMGPGGRALATDYSGAIFGSTRGPMAEFTRKLIPLARKGALNELFYDPLGGWDQGSSIGAIGGHDDHVHVALKKGGVVPRAGRGAAFIQGGGHWTASEAATLAYQIGATPREAKLLSRKVRGESGGNPHAHGPPDGRGLWQIERQFHPEVRGWNLYDPVMNAKAALLVLRKQGIGAWYAPSSAPGQILWDRILSAEDMLKQKQGSFKKQSDAVNYLLRRGVDKSRAQAAARRWMAGQTGGVAPPGKKKKKGKPGAAAPGVVDESMAERLAAANELIGEQNLLNLQNFNTGMAQHPVLGIPNPAAAAIAPFISSFGGGGAFAGSNTIASVGKPSVHSPRIPGPRAKQRLRGQPVILIEDGAVDAKRIRTLSGKEAKRAMRRAGRRANRRLPSGGGGGP